MKKIFFALAFALCLSACDNIEEDVEWIDNSDELLLDAMHKDKDNGTKKDDGTHPIDILPRIN